MKVSREQVLAWTLRGAPHFYRRNEIAAVAATTAPFSEADAAKRIFDASQAAARGRYQSPRRARCRGRRDADHRRDSH